MDGDEIVGAQEHADLFDLHLAARRIQMGGVEDQEEEGVIFFDFGPLMGVSGILDGEGVQMERLSDGGQFLLSRLEQIKPEDLIGCFGQDAERFKLLNLVKPLLTGSARKYPEHAAAFLQEDSDHEPSHVDYTQTLSGSGAPVLIYYPMPQKKLAAEGRAWGWGDFAHSAWGWGRCLRF